MTIGPKSEITVAKLGSHVVKVQAFEWRAPRMVIFPRDGRYQAAYIHSEELNYIRGWMTSRHNVGNEEIELADTQAIERAILYKAADGEPRLLLRLRPRALENLALREELHIDSDSLFEAERLIDRVLGRVSAFNQEIPANIIRREVDHD